jgi:2-isopropylmalate synthase
MVGHKITVDYSGGDNRVPTAGVTITRPDGSVVGNGPVNAICIAIGRVLGIGEIKLVYFCVKPNVDGSEAVAPVSVRIEYNGKEYPGFAEHTDTLIASARAVMSAIDNAPVFDAAVAKHTV